MTINGSFFTDLDGRTRILRGVNLGGSSKIPASKPLSFIGRPFPLDEADEHFERLKTLGFTFIRLIVTWEALEHLGPGIYDEAYLEYLRKLLIIAEKKGISVYMDPHQDVWSRMTGGDGAPAWTLEKLGMDIDNLEASGAAILTKSNKMIWPVNYSLYAAATMFTVFFGGNTFAPELKIDGEKAQDYLTEHYLAAWRHCLRRLKHCKAIVGWGTMNEPQSGFIGQKNLNCIENAALVTGPVPSPFLGMISASGWPVKVPVYTPWIKGWKAIGKALLNPEGVSLFKEGFSCPWKEAGVWTDDGKAPKLLKPEYFSSYKGRPIRFSDDFLKPFMLRFIKRMSDTENPTLFFIEGIPHRESPNWKKEDGENIVNAFHHYDGATLFTKRFMSRINLDEQTGKIYFGKKKVAAFYSAKLAEAKAWTKEHMNDMPCLLGEFGLPFDLNNKKAYKTGDFCVHEEALSLYYNAIDENLLSSTIWNYCSDNTHEKGDNWNGEDLSIVSLGSGTTLEPRAIKGWLRPYPMAIAGTPIKIKWDRKKMVFFFCYYAYKTILAPTEIFLPSLWFKEKPMMEIKLQGEDSYKTPGVLRYEFSSNEQRLFIYNEGYSGEIEIRISSNAPKVKAD